MQRILGLAIVVLGALVVIELVALRNMRSDIARLRAESVTHALEPRQEEIQRAGAWLHEWMQRPDGGARAGGLCPDGAPDIDSIRRLLFGIYLPKRAVGASEAEAREAVIRSGRAGS
jgi:hypothetical protein